MFASKLFHQLMRVCVSCVCVALQTYEIDWFHIHQHFLRVTVDTTALDSGKSLGSDYPIQVSIPAYATGVSPPNAAGVGAATVTYRPTIPMLEASPWTPNSTLQINVTFSTAVYNLHAEDFDISAHGMTYTVDLQNITTSSYLLTITLVQLRMSCPLGFSMSSQGSHCGRMVESDVGDHAATEAECAPWKLVSIHSDSQHEFVTQLAQRSAWIGITDSGTDPTDFQWTDGTPVDFTRWGQGQPNKIGQQCAKIAANKNLKWNDVICSVYIGHGVCGAPFGATHVTVALPASAGSVSPPNTASMVTVLHQPPIATVSIAGASQTTSPVIVYEVSFTSAVEGLQKEHFTIHSSAPVERVELHGQGTKYEVHVVLLAGACSVQQDSGLCVATIDVELQRSPTGVTPLFVTGSPYNVSVVYMPPQPILAAVAPRSASNHITFVANFSSPVRGVTRDSFTVHANSLIVLDVVVQGSNLNYEVQVLVDPGLVQAPTAWEVTLAVEMGATGVMPPTAAAAVNATTLYEPPIPLLGVANSQAVNTSDAVIRFFVNFSSPITGFAASHVRVVTRMAVLSQRLSGAARHYELDVTLQPTQPMDVISIELAPTTGIQPRCTVAHQHAASKVMYHPPLPSLSLGRAQLSTTSSATARVWVNFSAPVEGLLVDDITVTTRTAIVSRSLTGVDSSSYELVLVLQPTFQEDDVEIGVSPSHGVVPTPFTLDTSPIVILYLPPVATLSAIPKSLTLISENVVQVSAAFSAAVSMLKADDVSVDTDVPIVARELFGTKRDFVFRVTLFPISPCEHSSAPCAEPGGHNVAIRLPPLSGDTSPPHFGSSNTVAVTYIPPLPIIQQVNVSTVAGSLTFSVDFSCNVTGLDSGGFVVNGGPLAFTRSLSGSGRKYLLELSVVGGQECDEDCLHNITTFLPAMTSGVFPPNAASVFVGQTQFLQPVPIIMLASNQTTRTVLDELFFEVELSSNVDGLSAGSFEVSAGSLETELMLLGQGLHRHLQLRVVGDCISPCSVEVSVRLPADSQVVPPLASSAVSPTVLYEPATVQISSLSAPSDDVLVFTLLWSAPVTSALSLSNFTIHVQNSRLQWNSSLTRRGDDQFEVVVELTANLEPTVVSLHVPPRAILPPNAGMATSASHLFVPVQVTASLPQKSPDDSSVVNDRVRMLVKFSEPVSLAYDRLVLSHNDSNTVVQPVGSSRLGRFLVYEVIWHMGNTLDGTPVAQTPLHLSVPEGASSPSNQAAGPFHALYSPPNVSLTTTPLTHTEDTVVFTAIFDVPVTGVTEHFFIVEGHDASIPLHVLPASSDAWSSTWEVEAAVPHTCAGPCFVNVTCELVLTPIGVVPQPSLCAKGAATQTVRVVPPFATLSVIDANSTEVAQGGTTPLPGVLVVAEFSSSVSGVTVEDFIVTVSPPTIVFTTRVSPDPSATSKRWGLDISFERTLNDAPFTISVLIIARSGNIAPANVGNSTLSFIYDPPRPSLDVAPGVLPHEPAVFQIQFSSPVSQIFVRNVAGGLKCAPLTFVSAGRVVFRVNRHKRLHSNPPRCHHFEQRNLGVWWSYSKQVMASSS